MNLGRAEVAFAIAEPTVPGSNDATLMGPRSSSCGSVSDYSWRKSPIVGRCGLECVRASTSLISFNGVGELIFSGALQGAAGGTFSIGAVK